MYQNVENVKKKKEIEKRKVICRLVVWLIDLNECESLVLHVRGVGGVG